MTSAQILQALGIGIPAVVSVVSAIVAARYASRARLAEQQAARLLALEERTAGRKREVYEPFVETLGAILVPSQRDATMAKMEKVMIEFQTFVMIWGSDQVVEAFYRFRRASNHEPPARIIVRLVADLLIAIRKDIAWPNTQVTALQTLGSRITDLEPGGELEQAFTLPFEELARKESWTIPW
ncbi:hypothetical protein [Microbacterium sp. A84]|uniref:hypothetical protein n=1 Tax=Microbacterium sp. A84 TaxID=3450715 RepID=UPI003F423595